MFDNMLYYNLMGNMTKKQLAKFENDIEFFNVYNQYLNIALDTFEYTGLPDTCDERFLESQFIFRGTACLYSDKNSILWSLGASTEGMRTIYGYPDKGYVHGYNGYNERCKYFWDYMDNTDCNAVLGYDNKLQYPFINYIIRNAQLISDAKRAVQTAARNSKYSFIIKCNEKQAESLKNVYDNIQNNELAILVSKDNDYTTDNQVFNTNIRTGVISELWEYYLNLLADFKDILGIKSNKQADKKERLVVDEVKGDDDFTQLNLDYRLKEREKFCERCNKFLGTNISVKIKNQSIDGGDLNDKPIQNDTTEQSDK